jgi:hypothetical protein
VLAAHGTGKFEFAHDAPLTFHIRAGLATGFLLPRIRAARGCAGRKDNPDWRREFKTKKIETENFPVKKCQRR